MNEENTNAGSLYIVGTPIGNLEDITLRAARILGEVDFIAAEDTRRSVKLLNHLSIHKPLLSYHEHNKAKAGQSIIERLTAGESAALVTDAGMPVVSDPGFELVRAAREANIHIEVVPGPCAVSSALALSGMGGDRYVFEGFLARRGEARRQALERIAQSACTCVVYEAPHRLCATLGELALHIPQRHVAVCHDITKLHESVLVCEASEAYAHYDGTEPKGEYVLVVEGAKDMPQDMQCDTDQLLQSLLNDGLSVRDAAKSAAQSTGLNKSELYKAALELAAERKNNEA